jgi:hypothetical protein
MQPILIEISPGELIDRITILQLKVSHVSDEQKKSRLQDELDSLLTLSSEFPAAPQLHTLTEELGALNARLWDIEDSVRLCEKQGDFGQRFITLARSVYQTNDQRIDVKRRINQLLGLAAGEDKVYAANRT